MSFSVICNRRAFPSIPFQIIVHDAKLLVSVHGQSASQLQLLSFFQFTSFLSASSFLQIKRILNSFQIWSETILPERNYIIGSPCEHFNFNFEILVVMNSFTNMIQTRDAHGPGRAELLRAKRAEITLRKKQGLHEKPKFLGKFL